MPERLKISEKPISILIFIGALVSSISVLLLPIDFSQLAGLGYAGVFIINLLGAMTLFVPGPTLAVAFVAGEALNPLVVGVIAGLGSAFGETTGYLAGYSTRGFAPPKESVQSRWYNRVYKWMTAHAFPTLLILAAIPNPVADLSGIIAGRMGYAYPKYWLATFIGKSIRFGATAYLGTWFL